jgi:hypothetical protein
MQRPGCKPTLLDGRDDPVSRRDRMVLEAVYRGYQPLP